METTHSKKVLIALDYDQTAEKVAEIGYSMAKAMQAKVSLIHVLSDLVYYSTTEYSPLMGFTGAQLDPFQLDNMDEIRKSTTDFLETFKQHLGDNQIEILVKEGDFADIILKTASEIKADAIIMGSHGRKWLEKIILGSVTEKVLRHTTIPLLIIPTKKHN